MATPAEREWFYALAFDIEGLKNGTSRTWLLKLLGLLAAMKSRCVKSTAMVLYPGQEFVSTFFCTF